MINSKGVAFYASGNTAGEALRLYSTDLWTGTYMAKAVRPKGQGAPPGRQRGSAGQRGGAGTRVALRDSPWHTTRELRCRVVIWPPTRGQLQRSAGSAWSDPATAAAGADCDAV